MKQITLPEEAIAVGGIIATILVALGIISNDQVPDVTQLFANIITGGLAIIAIYHLTSQILQNKHEKWLQQNQPTAPIVPPENQP